MNDKFKGAFDTIKSDDELKKNTREFLLQKTRGYQKRVFFPRQFLAAAAKCLLAVMLCVGGYFLYFTPVSTISVDVNPSLELGVNRFDRVVSIDAYNEDAKEIVLSMNIRFLNYKEAVRQILADQSMTQYLDRGQLVMVTVFGEDVEKSSEMLSGLSACTTPYGNVLCFSGSRAEVAEAHSEGMSLGKYWAFLEWRALDPKIAPEDAKELTIGQIWNAICMLSPDRELADGIQGGWETPPEEVLDGNGEKPDEGNVVLPGEDVETPPGEVLDGNGEKPDEGNVVLPGEDVETPPEEVLDGNGEKPDEGNIVLPGEDVETPPGEVLDGNITGYPGSAGNEGGSGNGYSHGHGGSHHGHGH